MTQNQKEKEKGSDALSVNHRCSMQHPFVWAKRDETAAYGTRIFPLKVH